jgi:long-chain acyl-CoA synthetase
MIDNQKLLDECREAMEDSGYPTAHFERCVLNAKDTLPKILTENYKAYPDEISMRKKDLGVWNTYTWDKVYENVKNMGLGLKTLGLEREEKVCVIGDNDPEWYWAEVATQSMGAACVGMYLDAMPSDVEYLATNSDSVFAFAKDQEQVDKFIEIQDKVPNIKKVVYWDDRGMAGYKDNPWLISITGLMDLGREYDSKNPGFFKESVDQGQDSDIAVLSYTSGTTSLPKGAMISHAYLVKNGIRWSAVTLPLKGDENLSYASPAWIAEQFTIAMWLICGSRVNFPEAPETVMENIREIGPRQLGLGPMQWQDMLSQVQMKIMDTGIIRRFIYNMCMSIGYKVAEYKVKHGRKLPIHWKLIEFFANSLCLYHIRDNLGLSKLRYGITGGSALGPDVIRWFSAIGASIRDAYGLTEMNPVAIQQRVIKPGTSGPIAPGAEVKIGDDGEILTRSDALFSGYYKKPEENDTLFEGDWLKTGDCGTIDDDGHLIVYDRLSDMLPLKGGSTYSPSYIQVRLKFSPYIKEAMIVGGSDRDFLFGIITIDFNNVGKWAEKNRISYTTFVDLSQKQETYDLIEKDLIRVNSTLPENAKVRKYTLLHKEFDADEGELTKSRKLRRSFLEKRYSDLLTAVYSDKTEVSIEADVKYRDGRTGKVKTDLKIRMTGSGD